MSSRFCVWKLSHRPRSVLSPGDLLGFVQDDFCPDIRLSVVLYRGFFEARMSHLRPRHQRWLDCFHNRVIGLLVTELRVDGAIRLTDDAEVGLDFLDTHLELPFDCLEGGLREDFFDGLHHGLVRGGNRPLVGSVGEDHLRQLHVSRNPDTRDEQHEDQRFQTQLTHRTPPEYAACELNH